jgi:hypothetical protein
MGAIRNTYISVRKFEGKISLGSTKYRRKDNIKMNLKEIWCMEVDWIQLAQDVIQWHALVNTVMNL